MADTEVVELELPDGGVVLVRAEHVEDDTGGARRRRRSRRRTLPLLR
ncbi:hypothetical protein [Sphaerisporangium perillae]|nr:hypothetical protein [Sphaerisporangium perillae]